MPSWPSNLAYPQIGIVLCLIHVVLHWAIDRARQWCDSHRISVDRVNPARGTYDGAPCDIARVPAGDAEILDQLRRWKISGIEPPARYEPRDGGFLVAYTEGTRFEAIPADLCPTLRQLLTTLNHLFAWSYSIDRLDSDCMFWNADAGEIVLRLECRLRKFEGDSAVQRCRTMNDFGAWLEGRLPRPVEPLLADLLSELSEEDPNECPTPAEALEHPYFWDAGRKLGRIDKISDRLFSNQAAIPRFDEATAVVIGRNWKHLVDQELVVEAQQKIVYDGTKMSSLIRLMRNKHQHRAVDSAGRPLACVGKTDQEYFDYFNTLFPNLFLYAHYFVESEEVHADMG
jgi:hypothetical protein